MRNVDPHSPVHAYQQVADDIEDRIASGEFTIKLPGERAFQDEYGVAYQTVRRGMKYLRQRGVVITRQGRGTFVASAVPGQLRAVADAAEEEPDGSADG
jgi:GntR family transcriptional regulator